MESSARRRTYRTKMVLITLGIVLSLFAYNHFIKQHKVEKAQQAIAEQRIKALDVHLKESDTTTKSTRYNRLDKYLDEYISRQLAGNSAAAATAISDASLLAEEMARKTGEQIGKSLVTFYREVSLDKLPELQKARSIRAEAAIASEKNQFDGLMEKLDQAKDIFDLFNATAEILRVDLESIRILVRRRENSKAQLITEQILPIVNKSRYRYLEAYILYWQANNISETSSFDEAINIAQKSIGIFQQLDLPQLAVRPAMLITSIYYTTDRNREAFEQSYQQFKLAGEKKFTVPIQLIQILGLTAFNLKYPELAENYLNHALDMAIKQDLKPQIAMAYTFLGLIQAEQGEWNNSENHFAQAFQALNKFPQNEKAYKFTDVLISGYYARTQLLAGNIAKSKEFYQRALHLADEIKIEQKLALSQLHQGLGECLIAEGNIAQAKQVLTIAVAFDKQALTIYLLSRLLVSIVRNNYANFKISVSSS
jgi:tetratricopeptide (TPR) repeat protein